MVAGTMRVNRRSVLASWMNAKRPGGSVSCIAWRAIWLFSLRRIASSAASSRVCVPAAQRPTDEKESGSIDLDRERGEGSNRPSGMGMCSPSLSRRAAAEAMRRRANDQRPVQEWREAEEKQLHAMAKAREQHFKRLRNRVKAEQEQQRQRVVAMAALASGQQHDVAAPASLPAERRAQVKKALRFAPNPGSTPVAADAGEQRCVRVRGCMAMLSETRWLCRARSLSVVVKRS